MTEEVTTTTDTATADKAVATETVKTETIVTADTKAETKTDASTETAVRPDWPDDWRDKFAGEDKDVRKQLERYGSPIDVWKKARSLEQKLSSGEYKRDLPKEATAEEIKAWRTERGLPENSAGYIEKMVLPNGLVLGEVDKPVAESFAAVAHAKNWSPDQFSDAVAWYYDTQDKQAAAQAQADEDYFHQGAIALKQEWGARYDGERNGVKNFLTKSFGERGMLDLLQARNADGNKLGDDPRFLRSMAALNRTITPYEPLVPGGSGDPMKNIADRKAELMEIRRATPEKYFGKLEQEFLDLVTAEQKLKARAA